MDLAQATGAIEEVSLAGEAHPVRLLKMAEWGQFQAWLKRAYPSPVMRAAEAIQQAKTAGNPLDAATADTLLDHAQRAALSWPPRLNTKEWYDAIDSVDGGLAQLLHAILKAANPAFTIHHAELLVPSIPLQEWLDLTSLAFYGTHRDPKKAPAAGATNPAPPVNPSPTTGA